jgi:Zn-dependent protease
VSSFYLEILVYFLPAILFVSAIHGAGKALCAYYLGDENVKPEGRLSLNPLRHLDVLGFIVAISTLSLGWSRAVNITWQRFEKPLRTIGLINLSGVLANLLFAFAVVLPFKFLPIDATGPIGWLVDFMAIFFRLNISWAIFNLLPLPPNSGAGVLALFWPESKRQKYFHFLEKWGHYSLGIILFDAIFLFYATGRSVLFEVVAVVQSYLGLFILLGS